MLRGQVEAAERAQGQADHLHDHALGRPVKEMIGGFEYWVREGHPTEGKRPLDARVSTPKPTDLSLFC